MKHTHKLIMVKPHNGGYLVTHFDAESPEADIGKVALTVMQMKEHENSYCLIADTLTPVMFGTTVTFRTKQEDGTYSKNWPSDQGGITYKAFEDLMNEIVRNETNFEYVSHSEITPSILTTQSGKLGYVLNTLGYTPWGKEWEEGIFNSPEHFWKPSEKVFG